MIHNVLKIFQIIFVFSIFGQFEAQIKINWNLGWVWYRDGAAMQRNFNIIMTKYGVKTIK
ncbi:hypothetical protein [Chryseobacterium sp. CP-77]|uniref:hypothetical protein n=1 Tax=Chryseobacterium sp. CP-77 TaxID=3116594 RepID=UPI002ED0C677